MLNTKRPTMITAIIGRNASGKTQWVEQLRRRTASDRLRYIAFRDSYGPAVDGTYYLQLRWNQHDIDAEMPTAGDVLQKSYRMTGDDSPEHRADKERLLTLFNLRETLDKYIITLSSGELLSRPQMLILDNPFIGLDAETRRQLRDLLLLLARERGIDLYLVLAKSDDIPTYVDQVINMDDDNPTPFPFRELRQTAVPPHVLGDEKRQAILDLPYKNKEYQADEVINMHDVSIRYGERTILKSLDWTVRNGECWALTGQNGAGKSTLLSLVCADNPQSYACDIALFGYQRGQSGESIWDIKRHIGYVSPEMHRSYKRNLPAIRIVASGLMDTIGLYAVPNKKDYEQCYWWMDIFGIAHLANRPFLELSSGEQRLVLLARAFVKDPQLLILDEPLHGLDLWNRRLVKDIIETFCQRRNKTMIMVTHYQEELPAGITHQKFLARNL